MVVKLDELVYPQAVIQIADLYQRTLDPNKVNSSEWLAVTLFRLAANKDVTRLDKLSENIGSKLRGVTKAVESLARNSPPTEEQIREIRNSLDNMLNVQIEDEITKRDLRALVTNSLLLEEVARKTGKQIEIIDRSIHDKLNAKDSELATLVALKYGLDTKEFATQDLEVEGLYFLIRLRLLSQGKAPLSDDERKSFVLRLLRYVKKVSDLTQYLEPKDPALLPSPAVIRRLFFNATILYLIDYSASVSLNRGSFETFLDEYLGTRLVEEEKSQAVRIALTIKDFSIYGIKVGDYPVHEVLILFFVLIFIDVLILLSFALSSSSILTSLLKSIGVAFFVPLTIHVGIQLFSQTKNNYSRLAAIQ